MMFRKISIVAACSFAFAFTSSVTQAQFGCIQFPFGGYGPGVRVGKTLDMGRVTTGAMEGGYGNQYASGATEGTTGFGTKYL